MKTNALIISLALGLAATTFTPAFAQAPPSAPSTNSQTKPCFQCRGAGEAKCPEFGCREGRRDCPGPCLKLTKGIWEKRDVPGHTDPNERWQKVKFGKKSGYWSNGHIGEVPTMAPDGTASSPKCKVCNGAATVNCARCQGKGTTVCALCDGKKNIPAAWTAFDNPKLKERPKLFRLKDGRTVIGRKVMITGDAVTLRTADGDVKLTTGEILSEEAQPTMR